MLKRTFLSILAVSFISLVCFASGDVYVENLKSCSPYTSNGGINASGISANVTKRILGWQGNQCMYREDVEMLGTQSNITCHFSQGQLNELTSVMDAYSVINKYSDQTDFSDLEAAQSNPVVKIWNKYLLDPSVCTISTNQ